MLLRAEKFVFGKPLELEVRGLWNPEKHVIPPSSRKLYRMLTSSHTDCSRLHPEPPEPRQFGNIQDKENFVSTLAESASPPTPSLRLGANKSREQEGALAEDTECKMSGPSFVCHTLGTLGQSLHHSESQTLEIPDTPSSSLTPPRF